MDSFFQEVLTARQLSSLSSIVQIGLSAYEDLKNSNQGIVLHPFMKNNSGRIKTTLVQIQAELERNDPSFPFRFNSRRLCFGQVVPELSTEKVILHLARSSAPNVLPSAAKYKYELSYNNDRIRRQLMIGNYTTPPAKFAPLYGILVFGYDESGDAVIQFPEPGYSDIAEIIRIPKVVLVNNAMDDKKVERRKASLKTEYLRRKKEDAK